jgi:hypothetical protein
MEELHTKPPGPPGKVCRGNTKCRLSKCKTKIAITKTAVKAPAQQGAFTVISKTDCY